jgi:methyl-accepting chemotaxis protein
MNRNLSQRFQDLPIRTKLLSGFSAVLVLTVVLGVLLIVELGTVNSAARSVSGVDLPAAVRIGNISAALNDLESSALARIVEAKPADRAAELTSEQQDEALVNNGLRAYRSSLAPGQDTADYEDIQARWAAFTRANAALLTPNIAPGPATTTLVKHLDATMFSPLQAKISSWETAREGIAAANTRSSTSAYNSARTLGIALLVAAILIGVAIALLLSRSIKRALDAVIERLEMFKSVAADRLKDALEALAVGDLTREYPLPETEMVVFSRDELGRVQETVDDLWKRLVSCFEAYERTRTDLGHLVGEVSGSAERVSAASQQMSVTSGESARAAGEIAQAVGEIAQGTERQVQIAARADEAALEVSRELETAAHSAQETARLAEDAREVTDRGVGAAQQADAAMRSVRDSSVSVADAIRALAEKSDEIGQIVQTISGIAEQTNLLALNAAIEAARAGEQGRGFAVVAEEVRQLAEGSRHAADEISSLITVIQTETLKAVEVVDEGAKRTLTGVDVVEEAGDAFVEIGSAVEQISTRIVQVATTSERLAESARTMQESIREVSSVAEQSSAATEQVSASTQETSAATEQIAASADELANSAQALTGLVSRFSLTA